MIELTDEMRRAYEMAARESSGWLVVRSFDTGLRAVLTIVERDYLAKPSCVCLGSDWPHVPSSIRCTPPVADNSRDGAQ